MDIKKYIASGILEFYVAGALSESENVEVYNMFQKYPELLSEIEKIEKVVFVLTSSIVPKESTPSFKNLLIKMLQEQQVQAKVISIDRSKTNWLKYSGWAASILIGIFLFFNVNNNLSLHNELNIVNTKKQQFEQQLEDIKTDLEANKTLLSAITDKHIITIPLEGQTVAPKAYAKVYWNKNKKTIYVDVKGLPKPPKGKIYQLWSLKFNPLAPTSLGTIDTSTLNATKVFTIDNPNESQAFGITLEPVGGSKSPTLEKLYTLGMVSS